MQDGLEWQSAENRLRHVQYESGPFLAPFYTCASTDWPAVARALHRAESVTETIRPEAPTAVLLELLRPRADHAVLLAFRDEMVRLLDGWQDAAGRVPALPVTISVQSMQTIADWCKQLQAELTSSAAHLVDLDGLLERAHTWSQTGPIAFAVTGWLDQSARYETARPRMNAVLGTAFAGVDTDVAAVRRAIEWSAGLRATVGHLRGSETTALTDDEMAALRTAPRPTGLPTAAQLYEQARQALADRFEDARKAVLLGELDDFDEGKRVLSELAENGQARREWAEYRRARAALRSAEFDFVVDFAIRERFRASAVPDLIKRSFLETFVDRVLRDDARLRRFDGARRNALVDDFRNLDTQLRDTASARIIPAANDRRPKTDIGMAGLIRREAEKKTRHIPVRELLSKARGVIQATLPCFMMSPLAVSQYLSSDLVFDVVIFDEASQVSPGDAINCIYRGAALITAGDQRQLPPTSFFSLSDDRLESVDEEDDNLAKDYESILDLMKASGRFSSAPLRWHYRSRHENLIAYSNHQFYNSRLVTFPGAVDVADDLGVRVFPVAGRYRRGTGQDNPIEAAEVAKRVVHHFRNRPGWSCGVVTFSDAQRDAVELAVEQARTAHPDLAHRFSADRLDGFFVKSLESVQGDERDVIIFSVGYGPADDGKVYRNFGPLNRAGGERRLNVAITRARRLVEIVTSIRSTDLTGVVSVGAKHLQSYLEFAERGPGALATAPIDEDNIPRAFEKSVMGVLAGWGHDVVPRVGVGSYRVDVGVRDPSHPGCYVLGIECDGPMYHSARTARDGDRLRHGVLSGLGWDMHHIWCIDWQRDRKSEEQRLRDALNAALATPVESRGVSKTGQAIPVESNRDVVSFSGSDLLGVPYRVASLPDANIFLPIEDVTVASAVVPIVELIVAAESPIHREVLYQRLRDHWRKGRIGARIRETFDRAVYRADVTVDEEFVVSRTAVPLLVRTPTEACSRPVEHVYRDEIALAVEQLVDGSLGIRQTELFREVCRAFGWYRLSPAHDRVNKIIDDVARSGRIRQDGDRLSPAHHA